MRRKLSDAEEREKAYVSTREYMITIDTPSVVY